jgi:ABC-2 family transporter protein
VTALARVFVLTLRTVAPSRLGLLVMVLVIMAAFLGKPEFMVPAMVLVAMSAAVLPFYISDRHRLDTLYAVLPLTRRSLLLGRYVWALAIFVAVAGVGTPVALLAARLENISFPGNALTAIVAVSWALFALNISITFPLFVRFGATLAGMLGSVVPIGALAGAAYPAGQAYLLKPDPLWPGLLAAGCVLLFCASAAVAMALNPRRARRPAAV